MVTAMYDKILENAKDKAITEAALNEIEKELQHYKNQNTILWDRINNETTRDVQNGSNASNLRDLMIYTIQLETVIQSAADEIEKSPDCSLTNDICNQVLNADRKILKRTNERIRREKRRNNV